MVRALSRFRGESTPLQFEVVWNLRVVRCFSLCRENRSSRRKETIEVEYRPVGLQERMFIGPVTKRETAKIVLGHICY